MKRKKLLNYIKYKIHFAFNKIKEKLKYYKILFKAKISLFYEQYFACFYNFLRWRKIICIDNQYDYIFLLLIIKRKLELIEEVWGKYTNHENDYDEKEKLQELIQLLDKLIDIALNEKDVSKHIEYQKLSKSFFNKLHRLHDKLWD
jgi:hypothetical protein